jgi:hypothetical protein
MSEELKEEEEIERDPIEAAAAHFAIFVEDFVQRIEVKDLAPQESAIVRGVLTEAGFSPGTVVRGVLIGKSKDHDGMVVNSYRINPKFGFKVVCLDQKDEVFATGWLDCLFRQTSSILFDPSQNPQNDDIVDRAIRAAKAAELEIRRSKPLVPIRLTSEGDFLQEYPPSPFHYAEYPYFVEHRREDSQVSTCVSVGIHKYCGCVINRRRSAEDRDALVCAGCHLRVTFPRFVHTYGELRKSLSESLAKS